MKKGDIYYVSRFIEHGHHLLSKKKRGKNMDITLLLVNSSEAVTLLEGATKKKYDH